MDSGTRVGHYQKEADDSELLEYDEKPVALDTLWEAYLKTPIGSSAAFASLRAIANQCVEILARLPQSIPTVRRRGGHHRTAGT